MLDSFRSELEGVRPNVEVALQLLGQGASLPGPPFEFLLFPS